METNQNNNQHTDNRSNQDNKDDNRKNQVNPNESGEKKNDQGTYDTAAGNRPENGESNEEFMNEDEQNINDEESREDEPAAKESTNETR